MNLADHLHWAFRFTPASACRHNAVEGFSSAVTWRPPRVAFNAVADLQEAVAR